MVTAYRLGEDHPALEKLIREGILIPHVGGLWEVFTRETLGQRGELAREGDYLKIDRGGYPYPNGKEYFEQRHIPLEGRDHTYRQISLPMSAWRSTDPMCPEIQFLTACKGLVLNPEKPEAFFTAPLWGTVETADADAVLVFYSILRGRNGALLDADFNFVAREEFDKTYDIVCE